VAGFPHKQQLCACVWWQGGVEVAKTRVDVVHIADEDERLIFRSALHEIRFVGRMNPVFAVYRLKDLEFPAEGICFVEVYCEGEFEDDAILNIGTL
jgi:hypothetical protein